LLLIKRLKKNRSQVLVASNWDKAIAPSKYMSVPKDGADNN
jgi:hypothetical protein